MTAEIAVMNKRAIALAADSAVTIGDRTKFYNTANKLFMLSKYEPIGIMVYNNAEFMGVTWETIIKDYRLQLGKTCLNHLEDYASDFFYYLFSKKVLFEKYESNFYKTTVLDFLSWIQKKINRSYSIKIDEVQRKLNEKELTDLIVNIVTTECINVDSREELNDIPKDLYIKISSKFNLELKDLIGIFSEYSLLDKKRMQSLEHSCNLLFVKNIFQLYSGIVFAGFGQNDTFPSLVSYKVSGYIQGYIKKIQDKTARIDFNQDYYIIPFAQVDTVETFLHGVNNKYLHTLDRYFEEKVINKIDLLDDNNFKEDGKAHIKEDLKKKWKEVIDGITDYSRDQYFTPILRAIRVLPIDELASMAESLVNLTSFKRQMAVDDFSYTVGGPIDVAVISKGDGFIWIKRKHYFKPELNHHFFNNYFKEECQKEKGDLE